MLQWVSWLVRTSNIFGPVWPPCSACSKLLGSFWFLALGVSLFLSAHWILSGALPISGALLAHLSCLWNSVLQKPATFVSSDSELCLFTQGVCWAPHHTESWNYYRAHLVHFPSLWDQYPSLPDVWCLKKQYAISFVSLWLFQQRPKSCLLFLSLRSESLIITAFTNVFVSVSPPL